jgi:hypothetical protein
MPVDTVTFGFVVEGEGEVEATPLLVRRICGEIHENFAVKTTRPVRAPRSKLVRPGELERAIRLARNATSGRGPVLVLLDADDDLPCLLGPALKARADAVAPPDGVSIVVPKVEFEAWFLASIASLGGRRGLRHNLTPPPDPESVRGAKEWLTRNMTPGRTYSPTVDQAALAADMDLAAARACPSFDRFCREIARLLRAR